MTAPPADVAGVRSVLGVPEFRALLGASALSTLGDQVTRIAVAVLVFERTGSSFLSAATMACSYLVWLVLGPLLSSLADRWPRRRLMVACDAIRVVLIAALVVPDLPLPLVFLLLCLASLLEPPFDSARSAITPDVVPDGAFRTANTLMGTFRHGSMAAGFLLGGALCAVLSPEGALLVDAATFAVSAVVLQLGLREHQPVATASGSVLQETVDGFRLVMRSPQLRTLLAYATLATVALVAPEGLAVPTADVLGGGGATAGLLIATLPAGFLIGSVLVLRIPEEHRDGLLGPLTAAVCLPLLATPLTSSTALIAVLWTLTGVASACQLISNASYVLATPAEARGRAFGVALTLILGAQGVVLLAVGWLAEVVDPRTAVAASAAAALVLLAPLWLLGTTEAQDGAGHNRPDPSEAPEIAQGIVPISRLQAR